MTSEEEQVKKYELKGHSWGEAAGISKALIFIANELSDLNKNIEKLVK